MHALVEMVDAEFGVESAGLAGNIGSRAHLRNIVDKYRWFPILERRPAVSRIEAEKGRNRRRPLPPICSQIPLEPSDPARGLGDPEPLLGFSKPTFNLLPVGAITAHIR